MKAKGFLHVVDKKIEPPKDWSREELNELDAAVRNFIASNVDDEVYRQARTAVTSIDLLARLEQIIDPSGSATIYGLHERFGAMRYNPNNESALQFNNRFDEITERIRRRENLDDAYVKRNYLFAIQSAVPNAMAQEKAEFGRNKRGMTLEELKDAVLDDERDRKEESRRQKVDGKNQEAGDVNYGTGRMKYAKQSDKPFTKPSCTKCGYSPDGHTRENCPNVGRYCYGCQKFTDHIRKFCPDERAKGSSAEDTGKTYNTRKTLSNRKGKFRKVPAGKLLRMQDRRKKRNQKPIAFYAETDDEEADWVNIDPDDLDDEEFSYAFAASSFSNAPKNSNVSSRKDHHNDDRNSGSGSAFAATTGKDKGNITFILDCGCTEHIVNSRDNLVNFLSLIHI